MDASDIRALLAVCKDAVYDCKKMKHLENVPDVYQLSNDEGTRVAFFAGYVEGQRKIIEQIAVVIRESYMAEWKDASCVVAEELDKIAASDLNE